MDFLSGHAARALIGQSAWLPLELLIVQPFKADQRVLSKTRTFD